MNKVGQAAFHEINDISTTKFENTIIKTNTATVVIRCMSELSHFRP